MKKITRILTVLLLVICLTVGIAFGEENLLPQNTPEPAVSVAETTETATTEPESTPAMPVGMVEKTVLDAIAEQKAGKKLFEAAEMNGDHFADFYFGGVQTMSGIFSVLSLYANVPDYAVPTDAVLRICYTASDLILTDISSLTFYINGTPFYSESVIRNAGSQTVCYIQIPAELMQSGYNLLEISGYVRLTDDEGCRDDFNGANWIRFTEATCLRVAYSIAGDANALSKLPYPFISLEDATGSKSAVTVSDAADPAELTAAAIMMADLGTALSTKNEMNMARISETDRENLIYFGLEKNTPEQLLGLLGQEVPPTGALIQRVSDAKHRYLLVISNEPEALSEAAAFLSDATRVSQIHEDNTYITVGENSAYIAAHQGSGLALQGMYTLKDAIGHGSAFTGPFEQVATIYLPVAEDYTLSSESRFSLNIRYSANLNFERSLLTVFWGADRIPLYSHKLTEEGAEGETLTFSVPADAVGKNGTYITVVFDLEVEDLDCTPRQLNTPWAYIAENSSFYLPAGENTAQLSLANRPAPFQRNSLMNQVLVVLPDQPQAEELILAGRALAMLGSGSEPYGQLKVITAGDFNETDSDYNMILIGKANNHSLIRKLNDKLLFKYADDMTAFISNDKILLSDSYAREIGTVQLLYSPWNEGRAVMVLTAPETSGINAITNLISEEVKRWSLGREAVLTDNRGKALSYQFTVTEQKTEADAKPSFATVITKNKDTMIFALAGIGVMALLLIGVIIVLIRIRMKQKKEK